MKLKIKSLGGKFYDRDFVLLHAAFQILSDFYEKEWHGEPPLFAVGKWSKNEDGNIDYVSYLERRGTKKHNKNALATRDLYCWWQVRKDMPEPLPESQYGEDNRMLKKLIKVRGALWT